MKILVCVKQIPDDAVAIHLGEDKKPSLMGISNIVNPFDAYALEMAVRFKECCSDDTKITVISLGSESVKSTLKDCLAVGADEAYFVRAEKEVIDPYVKAVMLASGIHQLEQNNEKFSLVMAGKEASDIEFGQTGIYLAGLLEYVTVTGVIDLQDGEECHSVAVKQETDEGYNLLRVKMPAVLTVARTPYNPRYPTVKSKLAARRKTIDELIVNENMGRQTDRLIRLREYEPEKKAAGIRIKGETDSETASAAVRRLIDANML